MEHKIKIKLTSRRTEIGEALLRSLFDSVLGEEAENILFTEGNGSNEAVAEDTIEMNTEGVLRLSGNRVEIAYDESELTGMEGASTVISFDTDEPSLVTMMRGGTVSTALIFEPHRRHICAYHTPFMPFEVCVLAHAVDNRLLGEGVLDLDYIVELRGAQAERTKFRMDIRTMEGEDPLPRPEVMLG
jgi:uncharacterized beta-barrel protein YwiB (DUF1934 family)